MKIFDLHVGSQRLRSLREQKGLTLEEVASAIDCSSVTVKLYEYLGRNVDYDRKDAYGGMRIETLCKLATLFDVDPAYLLGMETSWYSPLK